MGKICGFGGITFDHVCFIRKMPKWNSTEYMSDYLTQQGGIVATAMVVASKLGNNVEYIGGVGNDLEGKKAIEALKKTGIETRQINIFEGYATPTSMVLVNEKTGDRTIINYRGIQLNNNLELDNLDLTNVSYIHLDGFWHKNFLENAKNGIFENTQVLIDPSSVITKEIGDKIFPYIDYIMPSYIYASRYTKKTDVWNACESFMKYSPKAVIITKGSEGCYVLTEKDRKHIPAYKVNAVNTNGACDTFHGGFISAMNNGYGVFDACKFASAVAALKCTKKGGLASIPKLEEVHSFISKNY